MIVVSKCQCCKYSNDESGHAASQSLALNAVTTYSDAVRREAGYDIQSYSAPQTEHTCVESRTLILKMSEIVSASWSNNKI